MIEQRDVDATRRNTVVKACGNASALDEDHLHLSRVRPKRSQVWMRAHQSKIIGTSGTHVRDADGSRSVAEKTTIKAARKSAKPTALKSVANDRVSR